MNQEYPNYLEENLQTKLHRKLLNLNKFHPLLAIHVEDWKFLVTYLANTSTIHMIRLNWTL